VVRLCMSCSKGRWKETVGGALYPDSTDASKGIITFWRERAGEPEKKEGKILLLATKKKRNSGMGEGVGKEQTYSNREMDSLILRREGGMHTAGLG